MTEAFEFFPYDAAIDRLTTGLKRRPQETIFVLGSALSAPEVAGSAGVLTTDGIIGLIRDEFSGNAAQLRLLDETIEAAGTSRYQTAFSFLQARRGQSLANEIVRRAVLNDLVLQPGQSPVSVNASDDQLHLTELDPHWHLPPGTTALGGLVTGYPDRFGKFLLTTNFDPLFEISVRRAGGQFSRTVLHADGDMSQTDAPGCHIVHLHGYWFGSDTLHTSRQLQQNRPRLRASLASKLREKLVVVCGYGGWDDVFTETLLQVASEDSANFEILWMFYSREPVVDGELASRLRAGINRGRVSLYSDVDCNKFFPRLLAEWKVLEPASASNVVSAVVRIPLEWQQEIERPKVKILEGDDEDRPPSAPFVVGREEELTTLLTSTANVIFLTGIGGEGKSTLAAQYFEAKRRERQFDYFVWRDCKEESERFENQLASIIERLSSGAYSGSDLTDQDPQSLVTLFFKVTDGLKGLIVFDNVDHFVNLETGDMTATPNLFIEAVRNADSRVKLLLTCRPTVRRSAPSVLSLRLQGISIEAARKLFEKRGATSTAAEVSRAHEFTDGHAFWLDLLATQVKKADNATNSLGRLLNKLQRDAGELPEKTLNSIWTTLKENEQVVLRAMAEAVKPETEESILSYVEHDLNYSKVLRILNALRERNLIVVKKRDDAPDLLELHPLVRQFIRQRFSATERRSYIDRILHAYARLTGRHKASLTERPPLTTLLYWTQTVELDIAAGRLAHAFTALLEVADAFGTSAYLREFSKTVRRLLDSFDWETDHAKYKGFDAIFQVYVRTLSHLGEYSEVDELLSRFSLTVKNKDSRYILYCDTMCFVKWERGLFGEAIEWGTRGVELKKVTHVDTVFDSAYHLALAQRDAGNPDLALPTFLSGRTLEQFSNPEEFDEGIRPEHYGNGGRCLYFMGNYDAALVCYQKSAILIERDSRTEYLINQGFARRWVGEAFLAKNEYRLASVFIEAARLKWESVAPPRSAALATLQQQFGDKLTPPRGLSGARIEKICLEWIAGRYSDFAHGWSI